MALSAQARKDLLDLHLPESNKVRAELQEYLNRSGLTSADFARRIGYSEVAMNFFTTGRYHQIAGNDLPIRAAILKFISTHPIAPNTVSNGRLYETETVRVIERYFYETVNDGSVVVLDGGPGMQKSFALEHLVAKLNREELSKNGHGKRSYYVYCPHGVTPNQLLKIIATACGSSSRGDNRSIIRNLQFDFRGRRANLIFDEAQHLSEQCLEVVRELHDRPPHFGMIFSGTHQLGKFFKVNRFQLEQWNRRIKAMVQLPGLSEAEITNIARGELGDRATAKFVDALIKAARAEAMSTDEAGKPKKIEYLSAGRVFAAINAFKSKHPAKGATA